jgi:hypothetical protein
MEEYRSPHGRFAPEDSPIPYPFPRAAAIDSERRTRFGAMHGTQEANRGQARHRKNATSPAFMWHPSFKGCDE